MQLVRLLLLALIFARVAAVWTMLRKRFSGERRTIGTDAIQYVVDRDNKRKKILSAGIAIEVPDTVRFTLRAENPVDRVAKRLGIARELQTGDAVFDRSIFVLSEDSLLLDAVAHDAELRRLARQLIQSQRASIHWTHGTLWAFCEVVQERDFDSSDEAIVDSLAPEVVPLLKQIQSRLVAISQTMWQQHRDPGRTRQRQLLGLCALLGVVGIAAYFWDEGRGLPRQLVYEAIEVHSAWTAAAIAAVLVALMVGLIRRSAYTHLVLIEIVLLAVPGAWFATRVCYVAANQYFDSTPAQELTVKVTDKDIRTGRRNSKRYYLRLAAWPDPRPEPVLQVTRDLYESVDLNDCVVVQWYRGAFGDPWIDGWRPLGPSCLSW